VAAAMTDDRGGFRFIETRFNVTFLESVPHTRVYIEYNRKSFDYNNLHCPTWILDYKPDKMILIGLLISNLFAKLPYHVTFLNYFSYFNPKYSKIQFLTLLNPIFFKNRNVIEQFH